MTEFVRALVLPSRRSAQRIALALPTSIRLWPTTGLLFLAMALLAMFADVWVTQTVQEFRLRGDIQGILSVGELYGHGIGVAFLLLAIAALDEKRAVVLRIACCAYIPGLVANLVKLMISRVRPICLEGWETTGWMPGFINWFPLANAETADIYDYAIQSFPSGHTSVAVGLAIGLCWRYPRGAWLFIAVAVLTATERVTSQAHYLSDVLAGAAVAVLVSGGFVNPRITGWIFDWFENRGKETA